VSMVIYLIAGLSVSDKEVAAPETMNTMLTTLNTMFNWNILLLLPPALILFGAVKKYPTLPVIIFSSVLAGVLGMFLQVFRLIDVFAAAVSGVDVSMVNENGFEATSVVPEVLDLVHQGGMQSMTSVILIAFSAFAFAGIMTKSGALEVIIEYLLKFVKRTGDLILTTVLSCLTMA